MVETADGPREGSVHYVAGERPGDQIVFEAVCAESEAGPGQAPACLEQRAAVLLLESLPDELRHEVVSVRAVTVEAMIFLVHSAEEAVRRRICCVQFLTSPTWAVAWMDPAAG